MLLLKAILSVRPTFRPSATLKISKYSSYHSIERCFYFPAAKFSNPEFRGSPRTNVLHVKQGIPPVESENVTSRAIFRALSIGLLLSVYILRDANQALAYSARTKRG